MPSVYHGNYSFQIKSVYGTQNIDFDPITCVKVGEDRFTKYP